MKKYSDYKPTNTNWIDELPIEWEFKRLKHIIDGKLKYGANEPAELDDQSLPRYIRITDFGDNGRLREDTFKSLPLDKAENYFLEDGDILFARSGGTVGKTFQFKDYKGLACFAGYLIKAKPDQKIILSDFLYYVTKSNYYDNWKKSIFIQATIQNIGADKYSNFILPVPSIREQNLIVHFLNKQTQKIDSLISKRQKLIDLLKEERSAVINKAVTKGINPDAEMKDSAIGWLDQVPLHWSVLPFFTLLKEHKFKNTGNLVKKVLSLSYGKIVIRNIEDNFGLLPESFEGYNIVDVGNIVLRLTDLQNDHKSLRCGLVREKGIITSAYTTIECNKRIDAEYAYYLLHLYDLLKVFYGMGGGVRQSIDYSDLKKMPILLPPYEEQINIVKHINYKIAEIDKNTAKTLLEIDLLQEYRTALISEAVTGKIDVRDEVVSWT